MDTNKIIDTLKNVSEIAPKAYDDAIKPGAQNIGKSFETITGLINTVLTPFEILNDVITTNKNEFLNSYHNQLNKIPPEKLCEPQLEIAGPIIEHAKYKISEDTLREKYANLLSASSNIDNLSKPLLSFDNVLEQLSPYEVDLLTYLFANDPDEDHPLASLKREISETEYLLIYKDIPNISFRNLSINDISIMLSNFERLGLITIDRADRYLTSEGCYDYIFDLQQYKELDDSCSKERNISGLAYPICSIQKHYFCLSEFGKSFVSVVIS